MLFDYDSAFSRNIGWITEDEQKELRKKTVAIAGMGGVGGIHLLTLVRMGIGNFHIADFDSFEVENFNRQAGAMISTIGNRKVEVLEKMALDINPTLNIKKFNNGVNKENIDDFLDGVDVYADGLDYFAFDSRELVFDRCHKKKIMAITAGPIGFGTALVNFIPGGMSFNDYFGLQQFEDDLSKAILFSLGLTPRFKHSEYLVDKSKIDLKNKKGPSTSMACQLCSGVLGTEVVKFLTGRGKIYAAPHSFQIDAFKNKIYHSWLPRGYRNPIQRFRIWLFKKVIYPRMKNEDIR